MNGFMYAFFPRGSLVICKNSATFNKRVGKKKQVSKTWYYLQAFFLLVILFGVPLS